MLASVVWAETKSPQLLQPTSALVALNGAVLFLMGTDAFMFEWLLESFGVVMWVWFVASLEVDLLLALCRFLFFFLVVVRTSG